MQRKIQRSFVVTGKMLAVVLFVGLSGASLAADVRPNMLWIVAEDASPHIGCYGETTIETPVLDQLAADGVRFAQAFVTCPVCSPSRSAMVTGMYQTTLGAHNHRSQSDGGKGKGDRAYVGSYQLPVKTVPRLFKDAGYFTCNSANGLPDARFGKTDYNFVWNNDDYDGADWAGRQPGQPFFCQVQLRGGKNRRAKQHATDPAKVRLPPYYPDDPVLRDDWADYLNS
jgi:arylsulfatase A-like enzyme